MEPRSDTAAASAARRVATGGAAMFNRPAVTLEGRRPGPEQSFGTLATAGNDMNAVQRNSPTQLLQGARD
jgi:hypothetical protein